MTTPNTRLLAVLGRAAPADLPPVSALGVEIALEALADASKLAVAADLDCWLAWCASEHRPPCPADPEGLVRYLRALEADGRKPATLASQIASLATVHRLPGLGDDGLPTSATMVRNALRGNRRRQGAPNARQHRPDSAGGSGRRVGSRSRRCSRPAPATLRGRATPRSSRSAMTRDCASAS